MTLDPQTEQIYKSLDNSALLSLQSVLSAERRRYREVMANFSASMERNAQSSLSEDEKLREMLASLAVASEGNSKIKEAVRQLRDNVQELGANSARTAQSGERHSLAILAHISELIRREQWVLDELAVRDLLPTFSDLPGAPT